MQDFFDRMMELGVEGMMVSPGYPYEKAPDQEHRVSRHRPGTRTEDLSGADHAREMLAGLGYEPIGFTSSAAALEAFRAAPSRFDAVLSDESMPEMTGSELARAIREIRADIPIVLMSGYVTQALSLRARDARMLDVLAKPLVARDIARSLAGALHD